MTEIATPTVATTIAAQLARRCLFMLGAKDLMDTGKALQFKVGRNAKRVTHVTVELTAEDLYVVTARHCRMTRTCYRNEVVETVVGVGVEQLEAAVGQVTGLATRL